MTQKILIVDDETDFCLIMRNYFVRKGYEVSLAYTLKEGLDSLRNIKPDIIFLDNNLPDGHGWDSIQQIVELFPQIRAYLVSAHRNDAPPTTSKNVVIWEKPISFSALNSEF